MPKIRVEIKWDKPKDKNWLNKDNIAIALSTYCKNTKFEVRYTDKIILISKGKIKKIVEDTGD